MGWVVTKDVASLRAAFDERFPNRDRASDGTIGDDAHKTHASSHNPDDTPGSKPEWDGDADNTPEVRGLDVDKDLRDPEVTMHMVLAHMIALPGVNAVVRYFIYDGHIYRASTGFAKEVFDGDPHTNHLHVTGAYTQAADNNATFNWRFDELGDTMAIVTEIDDATLTAISKRVVTEMAKATNVDSGNLLYTNLRAITFRYPVEPDKSFLAAFNELVTDVAAIKTRLAEIDNEA